MSEPELSGGRGQFTHAGLDARLLEAQVECVLQGHELGTFYQMDNEGLQWEAYCLRCGKAIFVSDSSIFSNLEENCPGVYWVR
jgi:hypothetical protein